jgi:uncharacterized protein (DUF927 family)
MVYYQMKLYKIVKFRKSTRKNKKYDVIIENISNKKQISVSFGDNRYKNYHDKTGLNMYPNLIHGDKKKRRLYKLRHKTYIRPGYFSPGYFSFYYLW